MTETTVDRDAFVAVLDEHVSDDARVADAEAAERAELERKIQQAAPEALSGDKTARAALEEAEQALFELDKRQRYRELARAETARREQAKLTAEQEAQRDAWRAEQATAVRERDGFLQTFEKTMAAAVEAAVEALDANSSAALLEGKISPGRGMFYRKLNRQIENRMLRLIRNRLASYYITPGVLHSSEGLEPLVSIAPACAACDHGDRTSLEEERASGSSLRDLEGKYAVSRSVLSTHFREHATE